MKSKTSLFVAVLLVGLASVGTAAYYDTECDNGRLLVEISSLESEVSSLRMETSQLSSEISNLSFQIAIK